MPLMRHERLFLKAVGRLKIYLLVVAFVILLYLLLSPSTTMQIATGVLGITLCGTFWLTQRLLSLISALDFELTRLVETLKRSAPSRQQEDPPPRP